MTHPVGAEFRPGQAFDAQLQLIYFFWIGLAAIAAFMLILGGFSVTVDAAAVFFSPMVIIASGLAARRLSWHQVAAALEGLGLTYFGGLVLMFLLYPLTAISGPYADSVLSSWDSALGFSWQSYLEICRPFTRPLQLAYNSFGWQPALVIVALATTRRVERIRHFLLAAFFATVLTAAVFPFLPAQAPFAFYEITSESYPELKATGTRDFLALMEQIRAGSRLISPETFTGVVAFPSYHAATSVLFLWALWPMVQLRWLVVPLNLLVLASTPVIGNHYLVDVLSGIAVGIISALTAGMTMRLTGVSQKSPALFSPSPP